VLIDPEKRNVVYRTNFLGSDCCISPARHQIPPWGQFRPWEILMDYLIEARKFIQQARAAQNSEIMKTDLEMAEWLLSRAIAEREGSGHDPSHTSG
jgi:hypothetical protein